jgi:hypothetical protein
MPILRANYLSAMQEHTRVMKDPVDELAVRREACVVDVVDAIAGDRIAPLVGTPPAATLLIVSTVRQEFVTDMAVCGDPHADKPIRCHGLNLLCTARAGFDGVAGLDGGRVGSGGDGGWGSQQEARENSATI